MATAFLVNDLVQIAGVLDLAEAEMIASAGADLIGFPLRLAFHREDASEWEAADIVARLGPGIRPVVITYLQGAEEIRCLCARIGAEIVQLHGSVPPGEIARLNRIAPRLSIIKSLIVRGDNLSDLLQEVGLFSPFVDAFILDSFDESTGACGATGMTHDCDLSRVLVERSERPVILAGGLNPGNVGRAIAQVRPAGVDVHTGVERSDGRKDERLVRLFVERAKSAFALS